MRKLSKTQLYEKAIEKWGVQSRIDLLIEEMAELTHALIKWRRSWKIYKMNYPLNVAEEVADVEIMLEQLDTYMKPIKKQISFLKPTKIKNFRDMVDTVKEFKLKRLKKLIELN